ncbi:MAG TPA: hypothetical protein VH539_21760 [Gemmatimonadaceae bacterium]
MSTLAGQAQPAGPQRVWVELGLGGSAQTPNCDGCFQTVRMGGPSASLALGLTITPSFGVALLGRAFAEISFDYSHSASYFVGLAQWAPVPGITLNAGLGEGQQHGDDPPYGDNGSGAVVAAGVAIRLPSKSTFGLTLNADWIKSVSGTLRTASGQPGSSYRPLLFTVGLGLNIASANMSN